MLLGDQEVGSSRPQAGDGVVRLPRRRLSITSPAALRGRGPAAEAGLLLQRLAVNVRVCESACVCVVSLTGNLSASTSVRVLWDEHGEKMNLLLPRKKKIKKPDQLTLFSIEYLTV